MVQTGHYGPELIVLKCTTDVRETSGNQSETCGLEHQGGRSHRRVAVISARVAQVPANIDLLRRTNPRRKTGLWISNVCFW